MGEVIFCFTVFNLPLSFVIRGTALRTKWFAQWGTRSANGEFYFLLLWLESSGISFTEGQIVQLRWRAGLRAISTQTLGMTFYSFSLALLSSRLLLSRSLPSPKSFTLMDSREEIDLRNWDAIGRKVENIFYCSLLLLPLLAKKSNLDLNFFE